MAKTNITTVRRKEASGMMIFLIMLEAVEASGTSNG